MENRRKVSKSFWWKLGIAPFAMFAFSYAMIPLYDVLCDITGLNGRTSQITMEENYQVNNYRKVRVDFTSSTMAGFPVDFYPKQDSMDIIPGKFYNISYMANNTTDKEIIGQAVPSVAPSGAALHFKKLECFCFTRQVFKPNQKVEMVVRFVVDPDMDKDIKNISLSYNFFKIS